MKKGLVSVLMPAYNATEFISESINSIVNQSYGNWELIILDDCSTDDTFNIARSFVSNNVRIYRNEQNKGVVESRNILFSLATGEFVAILDADDIALPSRLEEQVHLFTEHPDCSFIGTGVEYFGAEQKIYSNRFEHDELKLEFFFYNPIAHSTLMFHRSLFDDRELQYNPYGFLAEDYEIMRRLLINKRAYLTEKVLVRYRVNPAGISCAREKMLLGELFTLLTNLQSLGFDLPAASVVLLHRSLFAGDIKANEVIAVLKLLQEIEQKNNVLEVYNTQLFHAKLAAFSSRLLNSSILNAAHYSPFFITVLNKARRHTDVSLSSKQLISFYLKCLTGYRAKRIYS